MPQVGLDKDVKKHFLEDLNEVGKSLSHIEDIHEWGFIDILGKHLVVVVLGIEIEVDLALRFC